MAAPDISAAIASPVPPTAGAGPVWRERSLEGMVRAATAALAGAGLDAVRLVWSVGGDPGAAVRWRGLDGPPDALDALLVGRLVEHRQAQAQESSRDGRLRRGVLLVPPCEDGFLAATWDAASTGAVPVECVAEKGAAGTALQLQLRIERLRGAVDRLGSAERLQHALYAITDMAGADLEMPEMLRGLHGIVSGLMYAENCFIVRYSPERAVVRFLYMVDTLDPTPIDSDAEMPASRFANSLTLAMLRRGRALHGPSAALRSQLGMDRGDDMGPESADWLGVPMLRGSEVRGGIVVQSYDASIRYSDDDQVLLSFVATHILTALERKQAHEDLERRVEQRTADLARANQSLTREVAERRRGERLQAALYRIAQLSGAPGTPEQFYAAVHAIVGELIDARNFFIATVVGERRDELEFPYSVDEHDQRRPRRRMARGCTEYVLRTGRALLVDRDAVAALQAAGEVQASGAPSECWLGVPLPGDDGPLGVIAVQSYAPERFFSPRDQELLAFVAHHVAQALTRKRAQDSLREAYAELEHRVAERTRELAEANRELREQVDERERAELRLKHQAQHDALTGLPNRVSLLDRLAAALDRYLHDHRPRFAVLFVDLDRFKVINDSMGHLAGDEVLKQAGARISAVLRHPDMVARLGGDEFAILLENIAGEHEAHGAAQRVIDALSEPMRVDGKELFTSASVGIAFSHPRYARPDELLRDADVAMYRAKARGRHRWEAFDEHLHTEAMRLLDLEGDLRRAVMRNEFEPHFQPIVDLRSGRTLGYEALLRWHHPERGLLLPGDFLAAAEESGIADQIDWRMFDRTCAEVPRLIDGNTYVCINVSARHFRSPDLAEAVLALLRVRGIAPQRIRLEVTEGALLDNQDQIRRTLQRLREAGVLTLIDDFGTGYSSLSYLHHLPVHALKIDRSFVQDLLPGGVGSSVAVVKAIRALAESLGQEVIAEGIETELQREALVALGVTMGQGFLFARPRPADELAVAI
jgi:diguanylate cyclase (GGDEF)-like protein